MCHDRRREPERAQRAHAADAEHDLLAGGGARGRRRRDVRDRAILGRVLLDVGVEQAAPTRGRRPRARRATRRRDPGTARDARARGPRRPARPGAPSSAARSSRVVRELLAVAVDPLVEVALPVEQPDRDERQLEVARRLAVVAGEHAEAARVDRAALSCRPNSAQKYATRSSASEVVELRGARRVQISRRTRPSAPCTRRDRRRRRPRGRASLDRRSAGTASGCPRPCARARRRACGTAVRSRDTS